MADYFLDTSALVKRHVIEAGSAWVRSLVHARAAHDLYIARITAVEVTSAITRRQHGGHLSRPQADAMLGHFRRHLAQRYHVIELTPALFDAAMRTARKHRLRAYDAVQLAVVVRSRLSNLPLRHPHTTIRELLAEWPDFGEWTFLIDVTGAVLSFPRAP